MWASNLPESCQEKSHSTCYSPAVCGLQSYLIAVQFAHFGRTPQGQTCEEEIEDQPPQKVRGFISLAALAESAARVRGLTAYESCISLWLSCHSVVSNIYLCKQIGVVS